MNRRELLAGAASILAADQAQAFGVGRLGAGLGHGGALGRAGGPAGLPSLVASKAAADTNNPQINGLYATPPTVTIGTGNFTGITTAYPSTFTIAAHMAAYQYEGGLPVSIGGKVFLDAQSNSGSSSIWASYTGKIDDGAGSAGTILTVTSFLWGPIKIGQTVSGATGGTTVTGFLTGTGGLGTYTVSTSQLLASSPLTGGNAGITTSGVERRTITHTGADLSFSVVDAAVPMFFRILVADATNGQKPQYTDRLLGYSTNGTNTTATIKIDFGSSAPRTITIEGQGLSFLAFQRRVTDTMSKPADTPNPRIHFLCDSIGGPLNNPTNGLIVTSYTASCTAGVMTVASIGNGVLFVGQPVVAPSGVNTTIASFGTGTGGTGTYNLTAGATAFGGGTKVTDGQIVFAGDAIVRRVADMTGVKATIDTVGGTGWDTPTHAGLTTAVNRVLNSGEYAAMIPSHDVFVVNMGVNDVSAINGGAQTFLANTTVMISTVASICALAAANPTKIFVIGGAWFKPGAVGGNTNPPTGINATWEAAIAQAVVDGKAANPGGRVVYMTLQDIFWGNNALFNADLTHPTDAGEVYASPFYVTRLMTAVASV